MSKDKDKKFAKRIVVPMMSASITFTQITDGATCIPPVNQSERQSSQGQRLKRKVNLRVG